VNQTGTILFLGVDLVLVNVMVGADATGYYAPVLQWSLLLRSITSLVSGVLAPTIIGFYARGDTEGLVGLTKRAVKLLGLAIALPIGLLCGLAPSLLQVWLGPSFVQLRPLVWLMIAPLSVNLAVLPVLSVNIAVNKMLWPGVVTLAMGIGNLALAIWLAGSAGYGMYGVAIAGAIALTLKNATFSPLYAARILRAPPLAFVGAMVPALPAAALVAGAAATIGALVEIDNWAGLLFASLAAAVLYTPLVFLIGLSKDERRAVLRILFGEKTALLRCPAGRPDSFHQDSAAKA